MVCDGGEANGPSCGDGKPSGRLVTQRTGDEDNADKGTFGSHEGRFTQVPT